MTSASSGTTSGLLALKSTSLATASASPSVEEMLHPCKSQGCHGVACTCRRLMSTGTLTSFHSRCRLLRFRMSSPKVHSTSANRITRRFICSTRPLTVGQASQLRRDMGTGNLAYTVPLMDRSRISLGFREYRCTAKLSSQTTTTLPLHKVCSSAIFLLAVSESRCLRLVTTPNPDTACL